MGKYSSSAPAFSGGTININGENKVNTYKKGNNVISDYNMSKTEKDIYDYAQKSFADSLKSVNVFDNDTKKKLQSEVDAYAQKGQNIINNTYTPMLENLKNDVASRFGNFDNSIFMDNLNSIESKRAESMNSLAQDILAKQSELVNKELAKRYTYLAFLQDIQNQIDTNAMNLITASRQNGNSGNSYNQANTSYSSSSGIEGFTNLASNLIGFLF